MDNKEQKFNLKYTLTGFFAGIIITAVLFIIIINSADIFLNTESVSAFFAEHNTVAFLLFIPALLAIVIGYITDLNLNNILREKDLKFEETKQYSQLIFNFTESLRKGESVKKSPDLPENDKIVKSLINLSEEIEKRQKEEDQRKKEDAQRAKTSEGLAYFGAVLREHNNTIEELTQTVTNELVKYIEAFQAAFYLIDNTSGNKLIKEVSNYASGKKRLASKEFKWGEGLPGACIIEKKTTYLKNISKDYLEIESGLGSAKPRSLLIVPVVTQEGIIHGAIELASFKEYEDFEVKFIEQVAENTAMTISTLKINEETAILLKESREQAGALSSREDELQKTISEMRRLQENADMQSSAFRSYQDSTNKALIRAEFSNDGKLLFANRKFLKLFEYKSNSEIENENILKFAAPENTDWFDNLKELIFNKNSHFEGLLKHLTKSGKTLWIESSYIGLNNESGKTEKILFLGIDTTELKTDVLNLDFKLKQHDEVLFSGEFQTNGEIKEFNKKILKKLNYKSEDIISKPISDILTEKFSGSFENIINQIITSGNPFEGEIEFKNKDNEPVFLYGTIFSEKDINENINSLKFLAYDYSQQVNFAEKIREQENLIQTQIKEIEAVKERMNRRTEQVREEMRELYINTETAYIFSKKTFEMLPDAVITIDKENNIEFINESAIKLLNVTDKDITGKNIKMILPEINNKTEGIYLGDILNIDNNEISTGIETKVYITNKAGKPKKVTMLPVKVSVGLRQQLTVFLKEYKS
ncbi:MAG: PAS domain-containing protein [Bacteroidales bacterium]|nr:PAS domain-containing protein [Bacteroidales bacterium]